MHTTIDLAQEADRLARRAVETGQEQANPYLGTDNEQEFARRYYVALLRHSAEHSDGESSA